MNKNDKLRKVNLFIARVKHMADNMLKEGDGYDMSWHKKYCRQLKAAVEGWKVIKKVL